jgi:hypothetical protein
MATIEELRDTYAVSTAFVPSRTELPELLNRRRLFGCGVEVGVKQGEFSEHILRHWKGQLLISVDPWSTDTTGAYQDIANVPQMQQELFFTETTVRLAPFGPRSSIARMTSVEAAEKLVDHTLDFVYIDARHDFDSMTEDLSAWYHKLRPGAIFAGHDYLDAVNADGVFGVKSAVDQFFGELGIPVHATLADGLYATWIVVIPEPA